MAKEKEGKDNAFLHNFASKALNKVVDGFSVHVKDSVKDAVDRVEQHIALLFISFGLFVIGGVALIGAFMFYLVEYQGFSNSGALLCGGVIIIVIGLFIKLSLKGGRR